MSATSVVSSALTFRPRYVPHFTFWVMLTSLSVLFWYTKNHHLVSDDREPYISDTGSRIGSPTTCWFSLIMCTTNILMVVIALAAHAAIGSRLMTCHTGEGSERVVLLGDVKSSIDVLQKRIKLNNRAFIVSCISALGGIVVGCFQVFLQLWIHVVGAGLLFMGCVVYAFMINKLLDACGYYDGDRSGVVRIIRKVIPVYSLMAYVGMVLLNPILTYATASAIVEYTLILCVAMYQYMLLPLIRDVEVTISGVRSVQ